MPDDCPVGPDGRYSFTVTDAERTLFHLGDLWRLHVNGLPDDIVDRSGVTLTGGTIVDVLTEHLSVPYPDVSGIGEALDELGRTAADRVGALTTPELTVLLDATWLPFLAIADALRSAGAFARQEGVVERINASRGGVPKAAVDTAVVGWSGLASDRQASRRHHGRPWQALCLWSADIIDDLRAAGHPVSAGAVGENLTVRGVDWSLVRPGVRIRIGDVEAIVSSWAEPCSNIAAAFSDRDFRRLHPDRGAIARPYATVTATGAIATGDAITLD